MSVATKAGGVLKGATDFLAKIGIKAPWKYTGPASSPEYMSHLPKAVDYRRFGPASAPIRPAVPQAEEDKVYNIKYYTRDSRRDVYPGGPRKLERYAFEVRGKEEGAEAAEVPPTPAQPHKWSKFRPYLDNDNQGYTL